MLTNNFNIDDEVIFGRPNGEKTLGIVVKVNPKKLKIRQVETRGIHPAGTVWTVPPKLCTPAKGLQRGQSLADMGTAPAKAKRSDEAILRDLQQTYAALEPERLTCDGELRGAAVARRAAALRKTLRELQAEIGRTVSEEEVWRL